MNKHKMTTKEIGDLFLQQRRKLEFTVEEVNRRTHIHVKVIRDIENGAFENIGAVYLKSFLKKYSDFLALDTSDIMKRYEALSSSIPIREFSVKEIKKERERESVPPEVKEKKMQVALVVFLSGVLIALFFVLLVVLKAVFTSPGEDKAAESSSRVEPAQKTATAPAAPELVESKTLVSRIKSAVTPAPVAETVSLTLKARDEVWVQVRSGDRRLFDGILTNGETRSWDSEETITVWTGKANMLDFTVNKREVGVVAAGVVRNIQVSSEGIRVGDNWVKRFK
jgi:cytoskeleton protein RodZ